MSSVLSAQSPFFTVHFKIYEPGKGIIICIELEVLFVIEQFPETTVQLPVPTVGSTAVKFVESPHTILSPPAIASDGIRSEFIVTVS